MSSFGWLHLTDLHQGMGAQDGILFHDLGGTPPPPAHEPTDLVDEMLDTLLPGRDRTDPAPGAPGPRRPSFETPESAPPPGPGQVWRVSGTEKGSLLIFSKIEIRWDAAGNVVQDTFLDISNDWPADVLVKLYFINGDPPLDEVPPGQGPGPGP